MKRKTLNAVANAAGLLVLFLGSSAIAQDSGQENVFRATLSGAQEVPAISTNGQGSFQARLDPSGTELTYELEYSGLEGATTSVAHVHIGQAGVDGGVMFYLCGGGGKPACPNSSGTVTGTVTADDVIGPVGQGIAAGEFAEAIRAMRQGISYANVHTSLAPDGEVRGQINPVRSLK